MACIGFWVLTEVAMNIFVFWEIMLWSLLEVSGLSGVTSQKTALYVCMCVYYVTLRQGRTTLSLRVFHMNNKEKRELGEKYEKEGKGVKNEEKNIITRFRFQQTVPVVLV
jgi:hypothetical protein